jgi:hypothetical protein
MSSLRYEFYPTKDRKSQMSWPDRRVALQVISKLYIHRNVVVLSSDLGEQSDGLRESLLRGAGTALKDGQSDFSLTLLLKKEHTSIEDFVLALDAFVNSQTPLAPGYRERMV